MTNAIKTILKLEYSEYDDAFRAIVSTTDAEQVAKFGKALGYPEEVVSGIYEAAAINDLRDMINANHNITHVRCAAYDYPGDFGDAMRDLKADMKTLANQHGVDVSAAANVRRTADAINFAKAAKLERERLAAERAAQAAQCEADCERRAELRKDFSAWYATACEMDNDADEVKLAVAMRWAYNAVSTFDDALAKHIERLQEDAAAHLSWSGGFIQHAADLDVSKHIVDLFEAGAPFCDIVDAAMSELFHTAGHATSRSTSVMSNLMDDARRVAWGQAAKRLTGRSAW